MSLLRQITVLVLMPLMAWPGMPKVACRCSTGEFRLFCSRINTAVDAFGGCHSTSCAAKAGRQPSASVPQSGCQSGCCCQSAHRQTNSLPTSCGSSGCRCTPVFLASNSATKPSTESVPLPLQGEYLVDVTVAIPAQVGCPREALRFDVGPPLMTRNLVVLYQRFLT